MTHGAGCHTSAQEKADDEKCAWRVTTSAASASGAKLTRRLLSDEELF